MGGGARGGWTRGGLEYYIEIFEYSETVPRVENTVVTRETERATSFEII